eukprot:g13701.t1
MFRTALAVCGLQLLASIPTATGSGAKRTLYYQDSDCRLETFREFSYESLSIETDGATSQVGFGECYARGNTGAITTCNLADGTSTVQSYLDTSCRDLLYTAEENTECTSLKVEGETCPPGGPGSATTTCVDTEPSASINAAPFNLIGSPYKDMHCLERMGGDHVVSGHAFGVGSGACSKSPLVRGPRYALTECRPDSSVYAQVFGPDDSACAGDMRLEMVMFPRAASDDRSGGMCALGHFEDGSEVYYRLKACTTELETPGTGIGETPAPTTPLADPDGGGGGEEPTPVDYRGDGDDEDLQDDSEDSSEDDDENHKDSRDGGSDGGDGDGDGGSSPSPHTDDSGDTDMDSEDGEGGNNDNDNGNDSEDDSDSAGDGATQGGKDSGDGGDSSDDGLTDDAVFAIAFGVSVAVITCCLSALLALAGSGGDKETGKVGPKSDS